MVSAGSFILQKGWWVMNDRNSSAPAKLHWYPDLSCPVCGGEVPAAQTLYGGKEKRGAWIDALRESGGSDAVTAAVAEERKEIEGLCSGVFVHLFRHSLVKSFREESICQRGTSPKR